MGGGGWSRQLVRRKTSHLLTNTLRDLPALTVRIEQGLECVDQGVHRREGFVSVLCVRSPGGVEPPAWRVRSHGDVSGGVPPPHGRWADGKDGAARTEARGGCVDKRGARASAVGGVGPDERGCRACGDKSSEPRLNLSGSWQQGHSAAYNTPSLIQVVCK